MNPLHHRHRLHVLTAAALAMSVTACQSLPSSARKAEGERHWNQVRGRVKLQLAVQQFQSGQFDESIRTATESVALDPSNPAHYCLLARANLELSRPASAAQALAAADRAGARSPDLLYTEGVILEQQDRLEAALEKFSQALAQDQNRLDYFVAQIECLIGLNRFDEARRLLEERTADFDDRGALAALAAHVARLLGDDAEAVRQYRRAVSAYPGNRLIAEELGLLLVQEGSFAEAVPLLKQLVSAKGGDEASGAVRRGLAESYLALGDSESAVGTLADYVVAHPRDSLAQLLLAKAAIDEGDLGRALRAIDLAHREQPNQPEVLFVKALLEWKRGDLLIAAADLAAVLDRNPDDADAQRLQTEIRRIQSLTATQNSDPASRVGD